MSKPLIIIPARLNSRRFSGKILADLAGWPVLQWVYESVRILEEEDIADVIIAADDPKTIIAVNSWRHHPRIEITPPNISSGTERAKYVIENCLDEMPSGVVNLQADEPFINIHDVHRLLKCSEWPNIQVATLYRKYNANTDRLQNANLVKVVVDGPQALYFSRATVPYRGNINIHIGTYYYTPGFLKSFDGKYSQLALDENLEQLNFFKGSPFYIFESVETKDMPKGIDTLDDLARAEKWLNLNPGHIKWMESRTK